jgi:hypothetical protein
MGEMGLHRVGDESEGVAALLATDFDHRQHGLDKAAAVGARPSNRNSLRKKRWGGNFDELPSQLVIDPLGMRSQSIDPQKRNATC